MTANTKNHSRLATLFGTLEALSLAAGLFLFTQITWQSWTYAAAAVGGIMLFYATNFIAIMITDEIHSFRCILPGLIAGALVALPLTLWASFHVGWPVGLFALLGVARLCFAFFQTEYE